MDDRATRALDQVIGALDVLVAASNETKGLFPSIADPADGTLLETLPPTVPGQRNHDRAPRGNNLLHDEPIIQTMAALAATGDRPAYEAAIDRYLDTFATSCVSRSYDADAGGSVTGLFPWGEHAYWHLDEDRVGNSSAHDRDDPGPAVHDHLRLVPERLWERIYARNPLAVHDFADGLTYHWNDPEDREYIRHAYITEKARYPVGDRSCDFPRHGGHYVYDWAYAYAQDPHAEYRRRIEELVDYWWIRRLDDDLLPLESRGNADRGSIGQTLSHAVSLYEAAALLPDGASDTATRLRERGAAYGDALLDRHDQRGIAPSAWWASVYGGTPPGEVAATRGLQLLAAYEQTGHEAFLDWAIEIGRAYRDRPFPEDGTVAIADTGFDDVRGVGSDGTIPVWAFAAGCTVGFLADLYVRTDEERWLTDGLELTEQIIPAYLEDALPRGTPTVDHYENQLGTGFLLHGMARLALLERDGPAAALGPNYTAR